MNLLNRTILRFSFWLNVKKVQQVCNLTHLRYMIFDILHWHPLSHHNNLLHSHRITLRTWHCLLCKPDELISLATGELWVVQFCFTMYKHLKSVVSFVVKSLRIGNSTQVIFCRVVLLFSVQLLSARDNCLFPKWVLFRLQFGTLLAMVQVLCGVCVAERGEASRAL